MVPWKDYIRLYLLPLIHLRRRYQIFVLLVWLAYQEHLLKVMVYQANQDHNSNTRRRRFDCLMHHFQNQVHSHKILNLQLRLLL
jgi:hypothetical protein